MLAGIKDILIISTPEDLPNFKKLLKDGSQFGISFSYKEQPSPDGLAQAFIIGEEFIKNDSVALVLGDNIFYGPGFTAMLNKAKEKAEKYNEATVFGYYVKEPERFGVVEFDDNGKVISLEEKPKQPKSNYAVTGLYFYGNDVIKNAKKLTPSERNELEITDLNRIYLENNKLNVELFGRGFAWLDTGTNDSLLRASQFVQTIEENQGIKIACLEEIALIKGYLTKEFLRNNIPKISGNKYYDYIQQKIL